MRLSWYQSDGRPANGPVKMSPSNPVLAVTREELEQRPRNQVLTVNVTDESTGNVATIHFSVGVSRGRVSGEVAAGTGKLYTEDGSPGAWTIRSAWAKWVKK